MARREFSRKLRAVIVLRATNARGQVCCEGCGLVLGKKPYEIDHIVPEALILDKTQPLVAEDGQLLGKECCHRGGKTANDIRMIRHGDRMRDKNSGAYKRKGPPMAGTKASGLKKRMNGSVERRVLYPVSRDPEHRETSE